MAGGVGVGSPAVEYTLVGCADDPAFARAELLAELLSRSLPNFKMRKVVVKTEDWDATIQDLVSKRLSLAITKMGQTAPSSPFIYKVLGEANPASAPVGAAPTICVTPQPIGDYDAFKQMAKRYYSIEHTPSKEELDAAIRANIACAEAAPLVVADRFEALPVTVVIHNATSTVAYHVLSRLVVGEVFGMGVSVNLILVDDGEEALEILDGLRMELEDCASPYLGTVTTSSDLPSSVDTADIAVFFSGPIGVQTNGGKCTLKSLQAAASLGAALKPENKVVVVGEGCASAAGVIAAAAPQVPKSNISALVNVPQYRAAACIATKLNSRVTDPSLMVSGAHVRNVIAWGSDVTPPVIDATFGLVIGHGGLVGTGTTQLLSAVLRESSFLTDFDAARTLDGSFRPDALPGWVFDRDTAVAGGIAFAPSMTVASALVDHLRSRHGRSTPVQTDESAMPKYFDTVGLWSTGNPYGIPDNIFFPFPSAGDTIVTGLTLDESIIPEVQKAAEAAVAELDRCLKLVGLTLEVATPMCDNTTSEEAAKGPSDVAEPPSPESDTSPEEAAGDQPSESPSASESPTSAIEPES